MNYRDKGTSTLGLDTRQFNCWFDKTAILTQRKQGKKEQRKRQSQLPWVWTDQLLMRSKGWRRHNLTTGFTEGSILVRYLSILKIEKSWNISRIKMFKLKHLFFGKCTVWEMNLEITEFEFFFATLARASFQKIFNYHRAQVDKRKKIILHLCYFSPNVQLKDLSLGNCVWKNLPLILVSCQYTGVILLLEILRQN